MKFKLDMPLVWGLTLKEKPIGIGADGKLVFAPNAGEKDYILYDSDQEAPVGFGIRVSAKKTFVIRRKVDGKSIMSKVGNVTDFTHEKRPLKAAREKASELATQIVSTGKNPKVEARKLSAAELTLEMAFARYRKHMAERTQKPASKETLRVIDRVVGNYRSWKWLDRKVRDIDPAEIEVKYNEGKALHPVANEQAFRWASAAVQWNIGGEALHAASANREPTLKANPFAILALNGMYRTREQKEQDYETNNKRNPLLPRKTFGPFLEAAWSKRTTNDNETGIHFLIAMLLWGCRRSEHAKCQWYELIDPLDRNSTSYVKLADDGTDEYGPHIRFVSTKGGKRHRLPLTPFAHALMVQRQKASVRELHDRGHGAKSRNFVFPARSKQSKTGYYSNPDDLRAAVMEEAGVLKLTNHDLRRSFGTLMTSIRVPEKIQGMFFNHAHATVTDRYNAAEWEDLRDWMCKIEQAMLMLAPNVYNALKPTDWPPLPAPDPHICRPPAPRTGRPRKESKSIETSMKAEHV
ncbi:tyrosine-type recombinase/integrase [Massilia sp. P8910]|uniref:integrase family protein n=1 Tax=Massilia antarctica TaxID=2765360 RepID=UPI001E49EB59|nr:integrase family protein [Massilia antarctica]MCE3608039.1 tyrosine-type recombinase/integrase [Massilia antarctica]